MTKQQLDALKQKILLYQQAKAHIIKTDFTQEGKTKEELRDLVEFIDVRLPGMIRYYEKNLLIYIERLVNRLKQDEDEKKLIQKSLLFQD